MNPKVNQVGVETLIKIVNKTPSTNYDFLSLFNRFCIEQ